MTFTSNAFIGFLILNLFAYHSVRSLRWQNILLLLISYVFYATWDWRFCSLLFITTALDYIVGPRLAGSSNVRQKQLTLAIAIAINLLILFFFKYFNFFTDSAIHILALLGINAAPVTLTILLPVGISFYTLQSISYKLDVYRGLQEPEQDPIVMGLFTAYFPQLIAGPIERASHILPQFRQRSPITQEQIESSITLILIGVFRKIVIADVAASLIHYQVFTTPDIAPSGRVLMGIYLYALQIYGDFAGYSDIARGVSRLFGIELIQNFKQPYFAGNIAEFWRRWHISLSTWLRDYLFLPISRSSLRRYGNPRASIIMVVANLVTMTISGLWHGANWTFIVWGFLHGTMLSGHRLLSIRKVLPLRPNSPVIKRVLTFINIVITFHMVAVAWVFFRAPSVEVALAVLQRAIMDLQAREIIFQVGRPLFLFALLFGLDALQVYFREDTAIRRLPLWSRSLAYVIIVYAICLFWGSVGEPFIYGQF